MVFCSLAVNEKLNQQSQGKCIALDVQQITLLHSVKKNTSFLIRKHYFCGILRAVMKNTAYLLLGGNTGDVWNTFDHAKQLITQRTGIIVNTSSIYRSQAWGFKSEDLFLNQALQLQTNLACETLLQELLSIEVHLGRLRNGIGYASRNIDIDILFFNHDIINLSDLIVPHPRLHIRNFALKPIAELAPDFIHPLFNTSIAQLLDLSPDTMEVSMHGTPQAP